MSDYRYSWDSVKNRRNDMEQDVAFLEGGVVINDTKYAEVNKGLERGGLAKSVKSKLERSKTSEYSSPQYSAALDNLIRIRNTMGQRGLVEEVRKLGDRLRSMYKELRFTLNKFLDQGLDDPRSIVENATTLAELAKNMSKIQEVFI